MQQDGLIRKEGHVMWDRIESWVSSTTALQQNEFKAFPPPLSCPGVVNQSLGWSIPLKEVQNLNNNNNYSVIHNNGQVLDNNGKKINHPEQNIPSISQSEAESSLRDLLYGGASIKQVEDSVFYMSIPKCVQWKGHSLFLIFSALGDNLQLRERGGAKRSRRVLVRYDHVTSPMLLSIPL